MCLFSEVPVGEVFTISIPQLMGDSEIRYKKLSDHQAAPELGYNADNPVFDEPDEFGDEQVFYSARS